MGSQLSLFDTAPARRPYHFMGPHPDGPVGTAPRQALPNGLVALPQVEARGDMHYYIYQGSTWIGTVYHIGGGLWSLFRAGEHGVAGFGGPRLRGAAAQLLELVAKGKEVARA